MIEEGIIQIEENSSYRTLIKLLFGRSHDGEPSQSGKQLQPSKVPTVGSVAHFTTSIYIARNYNATYDKAICNKSYRSMRNMRIRNYRQGDIPTLAHIQQLAAQVDGTEEMSETDFEEWLTQPGFDAEFNVFLVTDDDELNEWGQGGTLEGIEGEVIGYTVLQMRKSQHAYHFLCEGAVLPEHRHRGAGQALLICAINHARIWSAEYEYEAQEEGYPIYFEALLPLRDPGSAYVAETCEMKPTDEPTLEGMQLYRAEL